MHEDKTRFAWCQTERKVKIVENDDTTTKQNHTAAIKKKHMVTDIYNPTSFLCSEDTHYEERSQ